MAFVNPAALAESDALFELIDQISLFRLHRPEILSVCLISKQRSICTALLATMNNDLARAENILIDAYPYHRARNRTGFCLNRNFTLGRALDRVRTEAWAQGCELIRRQEHRRWMVVNEILSTDSGPRICVWTGRVMNAAYRGMPGTYGWELNRLLNEERNNGHPRNRHFCPPPKEDAPSIDDFDCEKGDTSQGPVLEKRVS